MTKVSFNDIYPKDFNLSIFTKLQRLSKKSVLVSGTRGMLGGALAITLAEFEKESPDCNITLYFSSREWTESIAAEGGTNSIKYITNEEARSGELEFNYIIHCASPSNFSKVTSFEELLDTNLVYLEDCISEKTECVTYISSGEVYGGKDTLSEPSTFQLLKNGNRSYYPIAKLKTEQFLFEKSIKLGFSLKILRLFHTFGPGLNRNDGRSFADFLYAAAEGRQIELKTDGQQIRSFLYLGDAVEAILHFTTGVSKFELHNIGSNTAVSVRNFAEAVARISGQNIVMRQDDEYIASPFQEILPDLRSSALCGWEPHTNLEDAVNRTIEWIHGRS